MQDKNGLFHENVKKEKMCCSYAHHFSDVEKCHKWHKLKMYLPNKHVVQNW